LSTHTENTIDTGDTADTGNTRDTADTENTRDTADTENTRDTAEHGMSEVERQHMNILCSLGCTL